MSHTHRNGKQRTELQSDDFLDPASDEPLDESEEIPYDDWLATLPNSTRDYLKEQAAAYKEKASSGNGRPELDGSATLGQLLALVAEVRDLLLSKHQTRDYYTTEQAATILGRANWTVREWCRLGRVNAEKRYSGRGRSRDWVISHAELLRIQKEGLLPISKHGS